MKTDTAVPEAHLTRLIATPIGWYARTREAADLGPFPELAAASKALSRHIRVYRGINSRKSQGLKQVHVHDPEACQKTNCGLCAETMAVPWALGVINQ